MPHFRVMIPMHIDLCDETGKLQDREREAAINVGFAAPEHAICMLVVASSENEALRQLGAAFKAWFTTQTPTAPVHRLPQPEKDR